jgi:hypothetical protein
VLAGVVLAGAVLAGIVLAGGGLAEAGAGCGHAAITAVTPEAAALPPTPDRSEK